MAEWFELATAVDFRKRRGGDYHRLGRHDSSRLVDMKRTVKAFEALQALPVSVAILDASGTIVAVNDAWREFGRRNGLAIPNAGIGSSYLQYCPAGKSEFTTKLKELLAGRLDLLTLVYPCDSPTEKRWFSLIGMPLSLAKPGGVALLHVNLTGMLPAQSASGKRVEKAGRTEVPLTTDAQTVSDAIKSSVLESLSSQLTTMFTEASQTSGPETVVYRDADQILAINRLSKRQIQVLRLLGEGKTNKQIAEALFRSPNTIKLHVSTILKELKLKSRTQAALLASRLYEEGSSGPARGTIKSWNKTPTAG